MTVKKLISDTPKFPSPERRKYLRVYFGISQVDMAKEIGVSLRTFTTWESSDDIAYTVRTANAARKYSKLLAEMDENAGGIEDV